MEKHPTIIQTIEMHQRDAEIIGFLGKGASRAHNRGDARL